MVSQEEVIDLPNSEKQAIQQGNFGGFLNPKDALIYQRLIAKALGLMSDRMMFEPESAEADLQQVQQLIKVHKVMVLLERRNLLTHQMSMNNMNQSIESLLQEKSVESTEQDERPFRLSVYLNEFIKDLKQNYIVQQAQPQPQATTTITNTDSQQKIEIVSASAQTGHAMNSNRSKPAAAAADGPSISESQTQIIYSKHEEIVVRGEVSYTNAKTQTTANMSTQTPGKKLVLMSTQTGDEEKKLEMPKIHQPIYNDGKFSLEVDPQYVQRSGQHLQQQQNQQEQQQQAAAFLGQQQSSVLSGVAGSNHSVVYKKRISSLGDNQSRMIEAQTNSKVIRYDQDMGGKWTVHTIDHQQDQHNHNHSSSRRQQSSPSRGSSRTAGRRLGTRLNSLKQVINGVAIKSGKTHPQNTNESLRASHERQVSMNKKFTSVLASNERLHSQYDQNRGLMKMYNVQVPGINDRSPSTAHQASRQPMVIPSKLAAQKHQTLTNRRRSNYVAQSQNVDQDVDQGTRFKQVQNKSSREGSPQCMNNETIISMSQNFDPKQNQSPSECTGVDMIVSTEAARKKYLLSKNAAGTFSGPQTLLQQNHSPNRHYNLTRQFQPHTISHEGDSKTDRHIQRLLQQRCLDRAKTQAQSGLHICKPVLTTSAMSSEKCGTKTRRMRVYPTHFVHQSKHQPNNNHYKVEEKPRESSIGETSGFDTEDQIQLPLNLEK